MASVIKLVEKATFPTLDDSFLANFKMSLELISNDCAWFFNDVLTIFVIFNQVVEYTIVRAIVLSKKAF